MWPLGAAGLATLIGAACTATDSAPSEYAVAPLAVGTALEGSDDGSGNGNTSTAATQSSAAADANSGDPNLSATACYTPKDDNDFFGPARCCHTQAVLCEDFEGGKAGDDPNALLWQVISSGAAYSAKISAAQAARGSQSLHIQAANQSGNQQAMIVNTSAFPFAGNAFWGRAFVYWASSSRPNNHATYVAAGPVPNASYQWLRFSSFGGGQLGGNDSDPDNSSSSSTTLAQGAWTCIEWHFDPSPGVMRATYFADGKQISQLDIDPKHNGTQDLDFAQIELGWEIYTHDGNGAGWELFLDEIALGPNRIACAD